MHIQCETQKLNYTAASSEIEGLPCAVGVARPDEFGKSQCKTLFTAVFDPLIVWLRPLFDLFATLLSTHVHSLLLCG